MLITHRALNIILYIIYTLPVNIISVVEYLSNLTMFCFEGTHYYQFLTFIYILDRIQLRAENYALQVRPNWGSNSWPPDHDSTFHVTETPALTTWPSVTFKKKCTATLSLRYSDTCLGFYTVKHVFKLRRNESMWYKTVIKTGSLLTQMHHGDTWTIRVWNKRVSGHA